MIRRFRTTRVFYGWRIAAAAAAIQMLTASLFFQSFGAYVAVLHDQLGWSKTALAGAVSMQQLEGGLIGPAQGWVVDRFGARAMIRIGMVITGLSMMLLSRVHSLAAFYAVFALVALGATLAGFFPLTVTLVNWFDRKRARALFTMSLGFAMGGLFVPVVAYFIESFGWRDTLFASGVLVIVLGVPLAQVMRRRPEDHGDVVDGAGRDERVAVTPGPAPPAKPGRDFTAREAIRTRAFWLVSAGHGAALLVVGAVSTHAITHMKEDLGYSVAEASLVITFMTVMQIAGMVVGGLVGDRYEQRLLAATAMIMHMTGMLLVAYALNVVMVIAFALLHGFAWGIRGPLMQAIRADYFGRSAYGVIMGVSTLVIMIGQIAGPLVAGAMADATGSYEAGFTVLAVLAGAGSLFFVFAQRPERPEEDELPEAIAVATRNR
jgi:sugar phosphate permease